ncbi:hypothetical protein KFE25_004769 [Diacronema lutheri]|uniref:Uncharacterized protein n=1 Tax=Diacronema lutheri TaxID=2081491 RepID=A0A8J5XF27_DIALT|nr:hypothetical protein KFE25_004769 [Diacronema lutheri]
MPRVVALRLAVAAAACALLVRGDLMVKQHSTPKSLLSKVPVFLLTNEGGQPYLTQGKDGDQLGQMFLFLRDAQNALEVLKNMPGASDARMWKTDLHRAMRMAQRNAKSGLVNSEGREMRMLMRLHPHDRQRTNARVVFLRQGQLFRKPPEVPVFYAEGLVAEKRCGAVVPLFFAKEELDRVWSRMALRSGGAMPPAPKVTVTSLGEVLQTVDKDPSVRVDFYVNDNTLDWIKAQRPAGKARIFRPRRF